jgi:hypothetical protein
MKKTFYFLGLIALASLTMISCKKSSDKIAEPDPLAEAKAIIKSQGFDSYDLKKVDGGYIVEGDIFYSEDNVRSGTDNKMVPLEEQYRTFNLVAMPAAPGLRFVTIALAPNLNNGFWNVALQNAVNRYLATGIRLRFTILAPGSAANIVVTGIAGGGGQAGFPVGGNPFNSILMGVAIQNCGIGTATTVMAHEMGHCIGFRHTDWFNRAFSCGGAAVNEGQQFTGVGAVQIPGTPAGLVANSWMLACYICGGDRPFVGSDVVGLQALYL